MSRLLAASAFGTPPGTYLYAVAVGEDTQTFATIASDDSLTLFDPGLRVIASSARAHPGVICLASFGNGFVTAGRDAVVRCWDTRARQAHGEMRSPRGAALSALATRDFLVAAGTESTAEGLADVDVLLFDVRNASTPLRVYKDSHTDSITQLCFAPEAAAAPHILMSAGDDGLITIFDARVSEEEDALLTVLNPRAGVHCAGFLDARHVYVATADERFVVYPLSPADLEPAGGGVESDAPALDFGDVREKLHCTYIVDVVPDGTTSGVMAVGNHVHRTLQLVQLDPARNYEFGAIVELPGAHGEEVVRDIVIQHSQRRAVTCGEDGMVRVWDLSVGGRR